LNLRGKRSLIFSTRHYGYVPFARISTPPLSGPLIPPTERPIFDGPARRVNRWNDPDLPRRAQRPVFSMKTLGSPRNLWYIDAYQGKRIRRFAPVRSKLSNGTSARIRAGTVSPRRGRSRVGMSRFSLKGSRSGNGTPGFDGIRHDAWMAHVPFLDGFIGKTRREPPSVPWNRENGQEHGELGRGTPNHGKRWGLGGLAVAGGRRLGDALAPQA
jgi:hypothetical protein